MLTSPKVDAELFNTSFPKISDKECDIKKVKNTNAFVEIACHSFRST